MAIRTIKTWLALCAVLGIALVTTRGMDAAQGSLGFMPLITTVQPSDCTFVVNPGEDIQTAVSAATDGDIVCVREGIYYPTSTIRIGANSPGKTLVAYPGEKPVIDGQLQYPGFEFGPLIRVEADNTVVDGFELRFSSGRGIQAEYPANNVTFRNLDVHDNWQAGILAKGSTVTAVGGFDANSVTVNYVRNVLVENSRVYNNVRKARYSPVVFKTHRTGTSESDWTFDRNETWNTPFWDGSRADLPEVGLQGISVELENGNTAKTIYITSTRKKGTGYVGAANTTSGQEIAYEGEDILAYHVNSGKWAHFFDGTLLGLPASAEINAIFLEDQQAGCSGCYPVLMSFSSSTNVPGIGTVDDGDIIQFTPTNAPDAQFELSAGTYSIYRTASAIGLSASDDIDALARAPDGSLVISTAGSFSQGGQTLGTKHDLYIHNDSSNQWTLYYDDSSIDFNPLKKDVSAAWLDGSGDLYVSGSPAGGNAFAFIEAQSSIARGNEIYNNSGEGLAAGRNSDKLTFEDNVSWDNQHANIYLTSSTDPLLQRNFVYCTDDQTYWRKNANRTYKPGPGVILRDEDYVSQTTFGSSGQTIINNIIVGCGLNFGVYTQVNGGGLHNALIANNTILEAQGGVDSGFNNVVFNDAADYQNTRFINNILSQSNGNVVRLQGAVFFDNFTTSNNLYSHTPVASWFPGESGRIVANPLLINPVAIGAGTTPDPAWYGIQAGSPAEDSGLTLAEITDDFFNNQRETPPDIGAHERGGTRATGRIILKKVTQPASTADTFTFVTSYAGNVILGSDQEHDSGQLAPGNYSIVENAQAGWTLAGATCDDGSDPSSIDLEAAELVTCTFTNSQNTGTIIVVKETDPDGAPDLFTFSTDYSLDFQLSDGQSNNSGPLTPGTYSVEEVVQAGWEQTGTTCTDGSDPSAVSLAAGETVTCTFNNRMLPPEGDPETLYISAKRDGSVDGISYAAGDILTYRTDLGQWSLYLDTSDLGITRNIDGFAFLSDGSMLLTTNRNQTISNLGKVTPSDILRFVPASTGPNTSGGLEIYFDGSDVKLTRSGERIDALALAPDGRLLISTVGTAAVKDAAGTTLKARDEDLLVFNQTSLGKTTVGSFELYFDGSQLSGMASEDITGAWQDPNSGDLYLTILNGFKVKGVSGKSKDVIVVVDPGGSNQVSKYWSGAAHGLSRPVDALVIDR